MKMARMRREFGDAFMFVCDVSKILNPDEALENGRLSDETVARYKELVRSYLRVCDGVMVGDGFSIMRFDRDERVFFSSHYRQIVKLLKDVVSEPEFSGRKLLGLSAIITHQNPTVEFWTANEDGLRTITESLQIACEAEPDIILLPEWDEFNENSCVGPTLANGYSVKRILRYCRARLEKRSPTPVGGDDVSIPNLIVSYRRNVSPGERLGVDVLNVPDGARAGMLDVKVEILDAQGRLLFPYPSQHTDENELRHLRFPVDSASVSELTRAARVRVVWTKDGVSRSIDRGLHPISLAPANGWCKKEIHQPVRDIAPVSSECGVSLVDGRMIADIKCAEPIRYAFVCGNGQIQHVEGNGKSDCVRFREDVSNIVFAVSGISPELIDRRKFTYRMEGASSAEWLDRKGAHYGLSYGTDWISKIGDPYYVRIPRGDVENAVLKIDFGKVFQGEIPLAVAFRDGAYALGGAKGVQFVVARFRRQPRYPSVANSENVKFDVPVDGDSPSMMYHVQVVTMSGKTWRSAPFVVEARSAPAAMKVKSAIDGGLRTVSIPETRIPRIEYDIAADAGTFMPVKDRFLHFATVLGGQYSAAVLWNRSSAGGTDAPIGAWPDWAKVESSVPVRVMESNGDVSLRFDGKDDFVAFPWETVPQNSAYRISFDIYPDRLSEKIALFRSKSLLNVSLEDGMLHVQAAGVKKMATGLHLEEGRWQRVELAHGGDVFTVNVDGKTFSTPAKLPSTFMSPVSFGAPLRGSKDKPFCGRIRNLVFDHAYAR